MIPGYRIIRELGHGGMATVYLAVQESLGREVALKVLTPQLAGDEAFADRFLDEMRIAGGFRHPHIVPVHDAGQTADGTLYIAMEYVPGGTSAMLRGGDEGVILQLMREVSSALDYAHQHGVVHRDVKPENILRREDGSFVLSDFGIACSRGGDIGVTDRQTAIGSPGYMSPEQWCGKHLDGRSDWYSLGITCYELLTGELPFRSDDCWSTGVKHMQSRRPRLPTHQAAWQPLIDRLTAINPADRHFDAATIATALPQLQPTWAKITAPIHLRHVRPERKGLWGFATSTVLLATILVGVWWALRAPADAGDSSGHANTGTQSKRDKSIAVLPFRSLSVGRDDEFFSAGLSEELLNAMNTIPGLRVAGRNSTVSAATQELDVRAIGERLGVAHVLTGSVRRQGHTVRVAAQFSDARTGFQIWAKSFERNSEDVFRLQSDIAGEVAQLMSVAMAPSSLTPLRDPAHQTLWLEALGEFRSGTSDGYRHAQLLLGRLVEREPEFQPPYFLMALTELYMYFDGAESLQTVGDRIDRIATGSLQVTPGNFHGRAAAAMAQSLRAVIGLSRPALEEALAALKALIAESPNDSLLLKEAADVADFLGDYPTALALVERALMIDPIDPSLLNFRGRILGRRGDSRRALADFAASRAFEPRQLGGYHFAAHAMARSGHFAEALQLMLECRRAVGVRACNVISADLALLLRGQEALSRLPAHTSELPILQRKLALTAAWREGGYRGVQDFLATIPASSSHFRGIHAEFLSISALSEQRYDACIEVISQHLPNLFAESERMLLPGELWPAMHGGVALRRLGREAEATRLFERVLAAADQLYVHPAFPADISPDVFALAWLGHRDEALARVQARVAQDWAGERLLTELPTGQPHPLAAPLLEDARVVALINQIRERNARKLAQLQASGSLAQALSGVEPDPS